MKNWACGVSNGERNRTVKHWVLTAIWLAASFGGGALAQTQSFVDRTYPSAVFGENRHYRLFLPLDYDRSTTRYPVIYYFHGHSDRYTLEHYDQGKDTVPKIARFVASHPVIVVSVDGYVAKDYTGFYGGSPWDVRAAGGDFDFGQNFLELVAHIDGTYRTQTGRRHRATSGLSMGGFMSLWLSARYPEVIGSASSFNPGPEFYAGDKGTRLLWRPKDHVANHQHTMVRLIHASGDYISQYHEETRDAYAASTVEFEYRRDEYHRHWATSIEETFAFHERAFANPVLDTVPVEFHHASPYRRFRVWGYDVEAQGTGPGLVTLDRVTQCSLRVTTRQWAPDGPPAARTMAVRTPPRYAAGQSYVLLDHAFASGQTVRRPVVATAEGRLQFTIDGSGHELSLAGPGCGAEPPSLLPLTTQDVLRVPPGQPVTVPVRLYNPRNVAQKDVHVRIESDYPTVEVLRKETAIPVLEAGAAIDLSNRFSLRFTAGRDTYARARLLITVVYDEWHSRKETVPIWIEPEAIPAPPAFEILDGRTKTFAVFRQKGNQGGGGTVERTVTEGTGNGNGVLEPGETATIWVRLPQGLDPFDKNNWRRAKVRTNSAAIEAVADVQEEKQREWTGAQERTSLIRWRADAPRGARARLVLDSESWSFHFTPDVHYGRELLYQAFQRHEHTLHQLELSLP
jgi:poly(3-hydroxybutyrate) depolymerase